MCLQTIWKVSENCLEVSENCLEVSETIWKCLRTVWKCLILLCILITEMISLICIDVYAIRIRKSGVFAFLIRMALYQVPSENIFTLKLFCAYELVDEKMYHMSHGTI